MKGKISRTIEETAGVKQGHINSSDNYKLYINPALNSLDTSTLGVWIGPINVSVTGVPDDNYLISPTQSGLQALIDIAEHYGRRYKIKYGAAKTKITVVGSEVDMTYYSDTAPWKMGGQPIKVVEDNEHLGQLVSGTRQEEKNIDGRLKKGRGFLFSMLGPAFSYKCMLSPLVKMHIFRTFTCPIIRSGLSSFALRTPQMSPLAILHRKIMKSFLHLSQTAPTPAIHFLLGELPMEGKLHRDMFSLFYSVWTNPDTKIYQIIKYLLSSSPDNSRTWANNMRHVASMYGLEDPLSCLQRDPPEHSSFKEMVITKITAFHEKELRRKANGNGLMKYLNVNMSGLRGRNHPCLSNIVTVNEVRKLRPYLKFLTGDYLTYLRKYEETNQGSPLCKICHTESESVCHILSTCTEYQEIRRRILIEMAELCMQAKSEINFEHISSDPEVLTQFILDPSSFNLETRVNLFDPILQKMFKVSRDICWAINSQRMKTLKLLSTTQT